MYLYTVPSSAQRRGRDLYERGWFLYIRTWNGQFIGLI